MLYVSDYENLNYKTAKDCVMGMNARFAQYHAGGI